MRKITGPHNFIDPHFLTRDAHSGGVAIETPITVFARVLAGHAAKSRQTQYAFSPELLPPVFVIHLVHPVGDPADLNFGDVNIEFGKPVKTAAQTLLTT